MLRVSVKYLEKSAIIALPCEIDRMRKILDNLGCDREISKIPLITDENTELTVKVYSYGNLEKAIISKISKNDSLFDLNQLAEYLDRRYSLEPEFVQNMDVSGLQNLYLKLSETQIPETEKLVIHARLVRKEPDFTPTACVVEHIIPVSQEEFFNLRNHPLKDNPIIQKYHGEMCYGNNARHCILIYDEKQGDGLLIDSQGSHDGQK